MAFSSIAKSLKLVTLPRLPLKSSLLSTFHFLGSVKSKTPSPPSLLAPKTNPKQDFRQVFRYFDSNGDGKISSEEIKSYFESIGESMSNNEAQRVISEFDKDGDDLLEFGEFVELMRGDEKEGHEDDDDLRRAFEMFEVEKGSGFIQPKGLQQVFKRLGEAKSREECEAMIRVFDLDGNGVLDFSEFHKMMTQVT